jgi:lipopolysaccharide export LptBFGC system permease protein LptF
MADQPVKWYWKTSTLVTVVLFVGPLALPLVWFNSRYSRQMKMIITVIVAIASYFLWKFTVVSLRQLQDISKQLSGY